jgi:hypothetical protein
MVCVIIDFLVTIPFSFIAERWGIKVVLWCNLVPRVGMSAWAIAVGKNIRIILSMKYVVLITPGHYHYLLPTKAIIVGPFLAVLGGECVFQSTIFTLTSALTTEYVER